MPRLTWPNVTVSRDDENEHQQKPASKTQNLAHPKKDAITSHIQINVVVIRGLQRS
jgi:hypothetical protein